MRAEGSNPDTVLPHGTSTDGAGDRGQHAGTIIVDEGDEPNAVVDFFDAEPLSSQQRGTCAVPEALPRILLHRTQRVFGVLFRLVLVK